MNILSKNNPAAIAMALAFTLAAPAQAKDDTFSLNISSQPLGSAITELSQATNIVIFVPTELIAGKSAPQVRGDMSVDFALNQMLEGTGLQTKKDGSGAIFITYEEDESTSENKVKKKIDSKEQLVEEMIVTAQKREQNVRDVPISIAALGAVELEERGITNFSDLGMAVPGLAVSDQGAYRKVFLRGIGNTYGWTASLVGIYVDEVSVSANPAFALDMRLYDMERVEVLKGPQGTLYGDGAVGGAIRFITKDPVLDSFGGNVDVSASFTRDGAPGQKLQSVVNIPVIENELAFRVVGTFEREGGWVDQPERGLEDFNSQDVTNLRLKGLWVPNDTFQAKVGAVFHRNDGSLNSGEDENGNYSQFLISTTTPGLEDNYDIADVTLSYDFDTFRIVSSTSYISAFRRSYWEGGISPTAPPAPDFHLLYEEYPATSRAFSEELRLSSTDAGPLNWTLGAFYRDRSDDQEATYYFGYPIASNILPVPYYYQLNRGSTSLALFGDVSYQLTDRLEIGAGVRHFKDDRSAEIGTVIQEKTFSAVSPKFYVSYDVTDNATTYMSVGKGFRSGGFNSLGRPPFDPETIWSYEWGAKMSLWDGRLDAEIALFFSEYEEYQVVGISPPPSPPGGAITANAGNAEVRGVDWAFTWLATDNLRLQFNGNIVDSEIVELNLLSTSHRAGDSLDMIPENSYTLSTTYDFVMGGKSGMFRVDYNRRGKSTLRNRSAGDYYYGESDVIDMLNAVVDWQWNDSITFGFFAKNLLDDRGFNDPFTMTHRASRPRPRTFGVKMGMDF